MSCENGEHFWTASFFKRGALAFWFCSSCGETDRATTGFSELLENTSGWVKDPFDTAVAGVEPPRSRGKWQLADFSVLIEGDPCSVSFSGTDIIGLPHAHEYILTDASGNVLREYKAGIERASLQENCFILTRFQVSGDRLIKYRIRCCDENHITPLYSGEASGISILFGLKPVEKDT
jgi:hypothetical protein